MNPDQAAYEREQRERAFRIAEGSAAHEFGDNFDPGDHYRETRRRVIAGEITIAEAKALLLASYLQRNKKDKA